MLHENNLNYAMLPLCVCVSVRISVMLTPYDLYVNVVKTSNNQEEILKWDIWHFSAFCFNHLFNK